MDLATASQRIRNIKLDNVGPKDAAFKPEVFLHPMSKWHLYSEFKNGVNTGGAIDNVWLFGIIGFFVLLLACINFMNLSTARSEKRAKEVGIRKAIGSLRGQLVGQFYIESLLYAFLAFSCALANGPVGAAIFQYFEWQADGTFMGSAVAVFACNRVWVYGGHGADLPGVIPALYLGNAFPAGEGVEGRI